MLKNLRFFIPILFFHNMWLPLWDIKSIKQLTTSVAASRAPALAIPECRIAFNCFHLTNFTLQTNIQI